MGDHSSSSSVRGHRREARASTFQGRQPGELLAQVLPHLVMEEGRGDGTEDTVEHAVRGWHENARRQKRVMEEVLGRAREFPVFQLWTLRPWTSCPVWLLYVWHFRRGSTKQGSCSGPLCSVTPLHKAEASIPPSWHLCLAHHAVCEWTAMAYRHRSGYRDDEAAQATHSHTWQAPPLAISNPQSCTLTHLELALSLVPENSHPQIPNPIACTFYSYAFPDPVKPGCG